MPIEVKAVSLQDYQAWLAERKQQQQQALASADKDWTMAELMSQGETVYNTYCSSCHQVNGAGIPPVFPALAGSPMATQETRRADHINTVLYGKAGTAMSAFGAVLSPSDLAAVITYERNAWGNDSGDRVQPAEIKTVLEGGNEAPQSAMTKEADDANRS